MKKFKPALLVVAMGLNACGGGGGDTATPSPTPSPTDTQAPVITVAGGTSIEVTEGDSFTPPQATVTDNVDDGLSASVSGTVDTDTVGVYELTYSVTDAAGNTGTLIVTVTVVAPDVELGGGNTAPPINTEIGVAYAGTDRVLSFNTTDDGVDKSIPQWGLDTAWPSWDNALRGVRFMGQEQVDIFRISFMPTAPIVDGQLAQDEMDMLNWRIDIAELAGPDVPVMMNADPPVVDSYFKNSDGTYIPENWVELLDVTMQHIESRGHDVVSAAIFNEPDYWGSTQGTMQDFLNIAIAVRDNPNFNDVRLAGGNTLDPDQALPWYNYVKDYLDEGNTHQLAGSFNSFAGFFQQVAEDGRIPINDELHNVMEAMVGAEYGIQTAIWWGTAERARGEFVKASDGKRLAYAEHRPYWTSASVYRAPTGEVKAFAGASERQATTTSYRYIAKDKPVYFDGHGPMHSFVLNVEGGTGYGENQPSAERVVNITWGDDIQPVINGTYILVNKDTQQVLEVENGSTVNGDNIQTGDYQDGVYQQWVVAPLGPRNGGDFSYHSLRNANSDGGLDVYNWSLDEGGDLRQWEFTNGPNQHWSLHYEGEGWFSLCSRFSGLCLEADTGNAQQGAHTGEDKQLWRLIPAAAAVEFTPPAMPTGLTATAQSASVLLSWDDNVENDLAGYTVLRADAADGSYHTIARNVSATSFVDNSALPAMTYYYKVVAEDESLNRSAPSLEASSAATGEAGLVAHLSLESDTYDSSENDNHAAVSAEMSYAAGVEGTFSLRFSGDSQFIQLPATVAHHDELTISLWVNWDGGVDNQQILQFANSDAEYISLTPQSGDARMALTLAHQGETSTLDATPLTTGSWTHLAVVFATAGVELYQDGVLVAESSEITIRPNDFKPVINMIGAGVLSSAKLFDGGMDDIRIYNAALSGSQINDLYQANQ